MAMQMQVLDVMTHRHRLVTCTPETTVRQLITLLAEHHIRGMPVLGPNDRLHAVVTVSDVVRLADDRLSAGADLEELAGLGGAAHAWLTTPVSAMMSREPLTVRAEATLRRASRIMLENHIHSLPVTDRSGRLEGLLSSYDILEAVLASGVEAAELEDTDELE